MTALKVPNFIKKQPVAVVCALVCVGLAVAIYFQKGALVAAQADLDDRTSQGKHYKENVTNASKLDEQSEAMTQAIEAIEARLVHADRIPTNKKYFYEIQSKTQTKLTGLTQSGVTPSSKSISKTSYVGVPFAMNVQGTYPQILDFMRRVENGEHFSRLQGLLLSHAGDVENGPAHAPTLSLSLNLELLGLPGLP